MPHAQARKLHLPTWATTLFVAVVVYLGVWYAGKQGWLSAYWYQVVEIAAFTAISALGLNLIYGFNGQFSLGHIGFYAIGAYASALVTKDYLVSWSGSQAGGLSWIIAGLIGVLIVLFLTRLLRVGALNKRIVANLSIDLKKHEARTLAALVTLLMVAVVLAAGAACAWVLQRGLSIVLSALMAAISQAVARHVVLTIALLAGASVAALVAYLIGLPLLRLGSDYFGIATLGFAVMVYTALQSSDLVIPTMKGARGMVGIPTWTTWGWAFGTLCVVVIIMRNLLYSSHGRAVISVREDEVAARMMGIDIAQSKAVAFAFGGFFAGLAGGLYAHLFGFLHPSTFNVVKGFDPLIIIVLGGLGSMTGTILASVMFALLIEGLRVLLPQGFEDWRFVVYPIFLLLIMLLRKQGLLGRTEWGWMRASMPAERDIPVPELPALNSAAGEHKEA